MNMNGKRVAVMIVLATLSVSVSLQAQKKAEPPPLTLYVFTATDPSGFVDAETKGRLKAVEAVKTWIGEGERKRFILVSSREAATLILEVTGTKTEKETDSLAVLSNALNPNRPQADINKRVTSRLAILTVGAYSTELQGSLASPGSSLTARMKDWVKLNADKIQP